MSVAYSVWKITEKLLKAKKAYYTSGKTIMSDYDYDRLENSLRAIDPTAPILNMVGYDENFVNKKPEE